MKSISYPPFFKYAMSGSQTTTPAIPPRSGYFASISPKVLETDNLPGATL